MGLPRFARNDGGGVVLDLGFLVIGAYLGFGACNLVLFCVDSRCQRAGLFWVFGIWICLGFRISCLGFII